MSDEQVPASVSEDVAEQNNEISFLRNVAEEKGYDPDSLIKHPDAPPPEVEAQEAEPVAEEAAAPEAPEAPKERELSDAEKGYRDRQSKNRQLADLKAQNEAYRYQMEQMQRGFPQPQQTPSPPKEDSPLPDIDSDPRQYVLSLEQKIAQQEQWRRQLEGAAFRAQQQQNQAIQMRQMQSNFANELGRAESEWTAEHPDYPNQYMALKSELAALYKDAGLSDEDARHTVQNQMISAAQFAMAKNVHPARYITAWHDRVVGRNETPPARQQASAFKEAQRAARVGDGTSLSNSAAPPSDLPSPAQIRQRGMTRAQVADTMKKVGKEGMLALLERAETQK